MVSGREHMARHDDPEELPLVTESAHVVEVAAMDDNRTGECRRAAGQLLEALGHANLVDRQGGEPDPSAADGPSSAGSATAAEPPHVDWKGVADLLPTLDDGPRAEALADLNERFRRPFPSLLSIRVRADDEQIEFVPGQYLTLRFQNTPRPYSIASSPTEEILEFCVRRVPGGRLTTDLFTDLDPGDEVTIRGPNGHFVLDEPSGRDLAFLATGTGVAPLKSMIQYCFETGQDTIDGEPRDIWCFLGCAWADDLPYREYFRDLDAACEHFHFVPTLTREPQLTDWDGETAYVQRTLMKYLTDDAPDPDDETLAAFRDREPATDTAARIDPLNVEVYACGVSAMVETLLDAVRQVGVPEERASGEGFG